MKKLGFSGKLKLNKEVISKLQDSQMLDVKGGLGILGGGCSKGPSCSCTSNSCDTKAASGVSIQGF